MYPAKRTGKIVVDVWVITIVVGVRTQAVVLDIVLMLPVEQRAPMEDKSGTTAVPAMVASLDIIPAMTVPVIPSAAGVLLLLAPSLISSELASLLPSSPGAIRPGTAATKPDAASNTLETVLAAKQVPNVDGVE